MGAERIRILFHTNLFIKVRNRDNLPLQFKRKKNRADGASVWCNKGRLGIDNKILKKRVENHAFIVPQSFSDKSYNISFYYAY